MKGFRKQEKQLNEYAFVAE